jgi:malate dehydrogenase
LEDYMARVSIVGAGNVGATCAYTLLKNNVADITLIDVVDGLAKGKALDMMQAGAIEGYDRKITGTTDYAEAAGSEIVVITAGLARQPGMSRTDLLGKNAAIMKSVVTNVVTEAPEALILVVSNPVDILAYLAWKISDYAPNRVFGMSGVLDSARYKYFISEALDAPMSTIDGMVIGAHGDSMLPIVSQTKVNGWPLAGLLSDEKIHEIIDKTKHGGAEIVSYLKTGSAFYAPGASSARMVDAILNNKGEVLPCSVYAQGQYGIEGYYIGLPAQLGANGVEEIVEIPLTDVELEELHQSAASARNSLDAVRDIIGG